MLAHRTCTPESCRYGRLRAQQPSCRYTAGERSLFGRYVGLVHCFSELQLLCHQRLGPTCPWLKKRQRHLGMPLSSAPCHTHACPACSALRHAHCRPRHAAVVPHASSEPSAPITFDGARVADPVYMKVGAAHMPCSTARKQRVWQLCCASVPWVPTCRVRGGVQLPSLWAGARRVFLVCRPAAGV